MPIVGKHRPFNNASSNNPRRRMLFPIPTLLESECARLRFNVRGR